MCVYSRKHACVVALKSVRVCIYEYICMGAYTCKLECRYACVRGQVCMRMCEDE